MAKGVIGLRRELPIVHERRRNFPFCWAKRERHCLHLPRTRRRNGTATSCVTMTFREVLLMVLDGKSRGRERRAETFKNCPYNLLESFGVNTCIFVRIYN